MQYRLTIDVFCHAEQTAASAKALAEHFRSIERLREADKAPESGNVLT